ncbi:MAG: nuclease A inhibitor family protein [Acidobacteria bacterium]|nr:nuclease A inhibitor family protein [Acidobacteriota bacterium]MCA1639256.1 nuclease A inhibitor family protein [Acidobacteriota bacterium]
MSERNLTKTFLAMIFVMIFCALSAQRQIRTRISPLGNLVASIQERADNLVYISEQDWDVNVFVIGRNISGLNAETFQAANPFVAFEPIEEIDVELLFSRLEKRDEAWTNLRNYLDAKFTLSAYFKGILSASGHLRLKLSGAKQ